MSTRSFQGNFTQQQPIAEDAIEAAVAVLRSGRLHRYNQIDGDLGETALFETEFAGWQGSQYCLAVASCGQSIQIALRSSGLNPGDKVLTNAFTLAPVPGAIAAVGAKPILVEIDENLKLDLDDLEHKAAESAATHLLVSHMRGHLCDMDRLMEIATRHGLIVIEDCAHTMGASWNGIRSGNFGVAACFSTQTYKHMNSGEGGLLTSNDPELMARATILSGSYMHYWRHAAGPAEVHFDPIRYQMPNTSARMDELRASILRPQLRLLDKNIDCWNRLYQILASKLKASASVSLPQLSESSKQVGSSIQFRVPGMDAQTCSELLSRCTERGVQLKWFGRGEPVGFTSDHSSWRFVAAQELPHTDAIMANLFDMRLPLVFSLADCDLIGDIIVESIAELVS